MEGQTGDGAEEGKGQWRTWGGVEVGVVHGGAPSPGPTASFPPNSLCLLPTQPTLTSQPTKGSLSDAHHTLFLPRFTPKAVI